MVRPVLEISIRPMIQADLDAVYALQLQAYPIAYHEPVEIFANCLERAVGLSLIAKQKGCLCAYLLAYPWEGTPPPLHQNLPIKSSQAYFFDHVFLHDLAVAENWRGRSVAADLLQELVGFCLQRQFKEIRLVAVSGAESFWRTRGFVSCSDRLLHPSYGEGVLMKRGLKQIAR